MGKSPIFRHSQNHQLDSTNAGLDTQSNNLPAFFCSMWNTSKSIPIACSKSMQL